MSKYEDPTQLDYRYGGDTVDDFAQKYMKTVAYIFSALNELRSPTGGTLTQNPEAYQLKVDDNKLYIRNQANTDWILLGDVQENFGFRTSAADAFMHESDVADSGTAGKLIRADASGKLNADILGNAAKIADKAIQMGLDLADEDRLVYDKDTDTITNRPLQFKVDGDKIYARKDATTGWVLLGDLKQNLGFRSSTDDAFLTESDVADSGTAGKLVRADVNGKLNADILGNARKMAGKTFAPEALQDGQIPVYRASDGTWHAENKGTVGTGKNLMIMDGDKMLGEYNGDEMKAIDIQKSSLTKALAESTGYGIVSGCEPSINGLTVTVSAGVIHTADGRRVEVSEQSITLDAADATKPRTDVVYLDKYGKIAKLTGELGTAAVAGSNTYTISTNFVAGDTVTFGGVTFTCTASTQDTADFILGSDTATSATNLVTALNTTISAIYTASAAGSVITITENTAGGGDTPGAMTVTGTGVVTAGTAVASTGIQTTTPTVSDGAICVGRIFVNGSSVVLSDSRMMVPQYQETGIINVKDFGAVGDGATDDTNAIQKAVSAATNTLIYFPHGTYLVSDTITLDNCVIVGPSPDAAIITSAGKSIFYAHENVTIQGVGFQLKDTGYAVRALKRSRNITIRNCATSAGGLFVGYSLTYSKILSDDDLCKNIKILDNRVNNSKGDAAITFTYAMNCIAKENIITNSVHGISWWGGDSNPGRNGNTSNPRYAKMITITDNVIDTVLGGGIWGSMGDHVSVTGNVIKKCGDVGIDFEGCDNCTASGNVVSECTNGCLSTFFYARNITFTGNTVYQSGNYGTTMYFHSNVTQNPEAGTSVEISGNSFRCDTIGTWGQDAMETTNITGNSFHNCCVSVYGNNCGSCVISSNRLYYNTALYNF